MTAFMTEWHICMRPTKPQQFYYLPLQRKCLLTSGLLSNFYISLRQLRLKACKTNLTILPPFSFLNCSCTCKFPQFQYHIPSSFPKDIGIHIFLSILKALSSRVICTVRDNLLSALFANNLFPC